MKERRKANNINKVSKVLLFNIFLCGIIFLSFYFNVFLIFNFLLMPIYCKLYIEEKLFTNLHLLDTLSTTIFVVSFVIGCSILFLLDIFKSFINE